MEEKNVAWYCWSKKKMIFQSWTKVGVKESEELKMEDNGERDNK